MHEASLVEQLLDQVRKVASEHGGGRVTRIELVVGELSGVEPDLVRCAFDRLAPDAGLADAQL
ncbi:MAG TPA: hydrogenase maturation nickel metallochaperone HypA, partial [Pirellulaceae bacterium]|nr:hydrogenase maturation nickel metallochaperone HypA [Pirellulaceae bacterium]